MELYGSTTGYAYLFIDGELTKVLHVDDATELFTNDGGMMYSWVHEGSTYCLPSEQFEDEYIWNEDYEEPK